MKNEWFKELSNSSTDKYRVFSRDLTRFLSDILRKSYGGDFLKLEVYNFRKGSVVFDFTAYFKASTNATEDKLHEVMKDAKANSNFTIIEITVLKKCYPCICAITSQPRSATLIVVSIVCGVVITVLLVIILLLVVSRLFLLSLADPVLVVPGTSVTVL